MVVMPDGNRTGQLYYLIKDIITLVDSIDEQEYNIKYE